MGNPAIHRLFELYESRISKESVLERTADKSFELSRRNAAGESTAYELRIEGAGAYAVSKADLSAALLQGRPFIPTILALSQPMAGANWPGAELAVTPDILQVMATDAGTITLFLPEDPSPPNPIGNLQIVLLAGAEKAQRNYVVSLVALAAGIAQGLSPLRASLEDCPEAVEFIGRPDPSMRAAMEHLDLEESVPRAAAKSAANVPAPVAGSKRTKKSRGL